MHRSIGSLVIVLFFIWILPLGYFIKPSQEKIACDGQRAICMCHFFIKKAPGTPMEGYVLKSNSESGKESSTSGGGAGNYFLGPTSIARTGLKLSVLSPNALLAATNPLLGSIEHVPKV